MKEKKIKRASEKSRIPLYTLTNSSWEYQKERRKRKSREKY